MERSRLDGCIVLVVEDEPLVGLDVAQMLTASGAHVLCARRIADAVQAVDQHKILAAILDINLGGEDCSVLCRHLSQRQIPFVFYTGYTTPPDGWSDVPIISKPAWAIIAGNFGNDTADVEAARLELAKIILSFPHNEIKDAEWIKQSALQIMALRYRQSLVSPSGPGE